MLMFDDTRMSDYLVPLLLGLSFGNLWICALLVFSLQTTSRSTCGGYLVGRALTIAALSVLVSLVGRVIEVDLDTLSVVSGVFLVVFAAYLAATQVFGWVPPWKRGLVRRQADGPGCDGDCETCPTHDQPAFADACSSCADDPRLCTAEEPELEPLTRSAREGRGRDTRLGRVPSWGLRPLRSRWSLPPRSRPGVTQTEVTEETRGRSWDEGSGGETFSEKVPPPENLPSGFAAGLALGSLRGAALCSKLTVLVPVLLGAPVGRSLGMGLSFSISSSIYPLMGFAAGAFALKLV